MSIPLISAADLKSTVDYKIRKKLESYTESCHIVIFTKKSLYTERMQHRNQPVQR